MERDVQLDPDDNTFEIALLGGIMLFPLAWLVVFGCG